MQKINDSEFLQKVVELYQLIHWNEAILLIGLDNIILYAGCGVSNILDINPADLLNQNHLKALPIPEENIPNIQNSIDTVIKTRKPCDYLSINLNHHKDFIILHCIEKPIINPHTHNVVAISIESKKLDFQIYVHKLLKFIQQDKLANNLLVASFLELEHQDDLLTLREHEIAFLLLYCKTAKTVATILSQFYEKPISAKTIGNIISSRLYIKLGAYGIEALIDKLYDLGYHKKIPVSFITNMHLTLNS